MKGKKENIKEMIENWENPTKSRFNSVKKKNKWVRGESGKNKECTSRTLEEGQKIEVICLDISENNNRESSEKNL